jgi:tetratricopeptide (TPR) repeat protein
VQARVAEAPREAGPWPADVTRRLRVLLHTAPLAVLRRGDALRDPELRHYDTLALALRLFDVVIDRLGLEDEADRELVARELAPMLASMDESVGLSSSADRHREILDRVLAGLRNDGEARRPFREEYTALDDQGRAVRHLLEFRLLSDAFHASGRIVLRPSAEACNLYLRLLDLDIEDAQAATEAVVESQLARGRFDEAVQSARQARIQSVQFREKVLRILRETRRDVERVDWRREVPRMLAEAREHLARRLRVEQEILNAADERLDVMIEGGEPTRAVVQVAELIRDCRIRHVELHEELMRARNVFLDMQARQSFATTPSRPLPDLLNDVLEPLFAQPVAAAGPAAERCVPLLMGPRPPVLLSLMALVSWMLQPRRTQPAHEIPVDAIDPSVLDMEISRYPQEVRAEATGILAAIGTATSLSVLLSQARAQGAADTVLEVLALLCLQSFASEDRKAARLQAEKIPNGHLADAGFYGDDLLVSPNGSSSDQA